MDELIVNVDECSLDVNLDLMNIASDDDDGLVSLESPDGDVVQPIPNGESACAAGEGDDSQKGAYERKPMKKTYPIWKDFKEVLHSGVKKAQCIYCKFVLGILASGATT